MYILYKHPLFIDVYFCKNNATDSFTKVYPKKTTKDLALKVGNLYQ